MYSAELPLKQAKSEPNIWSAVLALDAKYNHYRFLNSQLRTLYIKVKELFPSSSFSSSCVLFGI